MSKSNYRARPHYVYRAFDDRDRLLYVGCTCDIDARMVAHRHSSAWWPHKVRLVVTDAMPFDEARRVEAEAIQAEGPLYNGEEPRRRHTVRMWEQIHDAASALSSHDGWIFNDCHDIGSATANLFFRRPQIGEPFDNFTDYWTARNHRDYFMHDQLPPTRRALWTLLDSGWEPNLDLPSRPRWEILPRPRHLYGDEELDRIAEAMI